MDQSLKMAGAAVVGAGIGFFAGYKLLEKRLSEQFDERMQREEELMRQHYSLVKKPYATPQEALKDLVPEAPKADEDPRDKNMRVAYHKIVQTEYVESQGDEAEAAAAVEQTVSVFNNTPRDSAKPYVVAEDEYMANDSGFEQSTLTYYEADDTLVDERDEIIASPHDVIGEQFRTQFGVDSRNENIVYFRHEKLGLEFEVVRSEGSYKKEVLGEESG